MVRYDMTGIRINLREVPLGLILDGPAHTAGVRQGDELLSVNGVDVRGRTAFEASSLLQGPSETYLFIVAIGEDENCDVPLVSNSKAFFFIVAIGEDENCDVYVRF